ncbi:MAG: hypothetical protein NDI90_10900 [Nitrospira sp. BO4]|jgi:hypothetical protein|nr:hypothetical protein [Nitrospira sp. BO4]
MSPGLLSRIEIDCILSKGSEDLRGDGCIYELSSSPPTISNPAKIRPGDYVKLRLWFPDESSHIYIELAEIQWVKNHWIKVDILAVSPKDKARLKQFVASEGHSASSSLKMIEQILIRA